MIRSDLRLGKFWGIPIGLHNSWLLIFALVTWTLAVTHFPEQYPELGATAVWAKGIITSILFFGSVLAHELGHALMARREGVPVKGITLFVFGGIAQIEKQPPTPQSEFKITVLGPLVSFGLAAAFWGLSFAFAGVSWIAGPAFWLARVNLILAAFNLIPGFPLDGGRILRAAVWYFTDNFYKANRWASVSGKVIAAVLALAGIFSVVLTDDFVSSLWLMLLAWFLNTAADANSNASYIQERLKDVRVSDLMTDKWERIAARLPISRLMNDHILQTGCSVFFVFHDGFGYDEAAVRPSGLVSLTDVQQLSPTAWGITPAEKVMTKWEEVITTNQDASVVETLQVMQKHDVRQLPVVAGDQVLGVITRRQIEKYAGKLSEG